MKFSLCGLKFQAQAPTWLYFNFWTYPSCLKALSLFHSDSWVSVLQQWARASGLTGLASLQVPPCSSTGCSCNYVLLSLLSHATDLARVPVSAIRFQVKVYNCVFLFHLAFDNVCMFLKTTFLFY